MMNEDPCNVLDEDRLAWSEELEKHFLGEFSTASLQANLNMEDRSQVDVCKNATFVGLYDGCKDNTAADYLCNNAFPTLLSKFILINTLVLHSFMKIAFA